MSRIALPPQKDAGRRLTEPSGGGRCGAPGGPGPQLLAGIAASAATQAGGEPALPATPRSPAPSRHLPPPAGPERRAASPSPGGASRRALLHGIAGAALSGVAPAMAAPAGAASFGGDAFAHAVRAAEALGGGRLGVALRDSETGQGFAWRGEERFPVTSTFKFLLAAAVLAAVDRGEERLDRRIPIRAADLVPHAPVTAGHVGPEGLGVAALCEAIITVSDNPAANLLLATLGGPAGLTGFARRIGDAQFRLDRQETALNEARPGDPRDTTTPRAMLEDLDRLLLGTVLSPGSRVRLTDWLLGCRTGDRRLRAGLPRDWRCGDKTGSGGHGTANDIAILWPPGRRPILVAAYLTESAAPAEARDAALAAIGRAIAAAPG